MGFLSHFLKKKDDPVPYDWEFLKQQCLLAIRSYPVSAELKQSTLGDLDYERLEVSGEVAEDVVVEIWAVLRNAKTPGFSPTQTQEYLFRAGELLCADISANAAAAGLREIEESIRKK